MADIYVSIDGTLYLLHFSPPYKHARHYLGWTQNPEARFDQHIAGRGSPLVRAAVSAGCRVTVAWTKPGTRDDERALKAGKNVPRLCPICKETSHDLSAHALSGLHDHRP